MSTNLIKAALGAVLVLWLFVCYPIVLLTLVLLGALTSFFYVMLEVNNHGHS